MSSQKRKLHSEDAEASPSKKKTKHASPSKKKTQDAKIFPKAHKRPRSLFETRIIISSEESDSDFQDDADNDSDWIAETKSKCLSSEGESDRNEATDDTTRDAEKVTQGLKKKKKMKRTKKGKKEMKTAVRRKKEEGVTHKNGAEEETCDICMRGVNKYHMKKHKEGHAQYERYETATGVYKCFNCLKCYDDRYKLGAHRRYFCPLNATSEKKDSAEDGGTSKDAQQSKSKSMFKCDTCSAQFESFSDLQEHSKRHSKGGTRFVRCPKCSLVFCSFHKLKIHNTVVHINKGLGVYKCKVCDKGFGSKTLLRIHKKDKHGKDGVTYKCHYCHLIYKTWQLRQHHIRLSHATKYVCEYCGSTITTNIRASHQRKCKMNPKNQQQSKKQKPVNAAPCSSKETSSNVASVTSLQTLQPESVTSLALRKQPHAECYECKKCLITFESKNNYVIHKRTCQSATEREVNRIYACEACPEIFSSSLKLCVHEAAEHQSLFCIDCREIVPDEETLEMHVMLECPERYKLFSNKTHREEIDTNRDAAEVVETTQENEKASNPVNSSPTTCTDVNIENVNKQMNDIPRDEKPNISGIGEGNAGKDVNNENASSDDKNNQTHDGQVIVCKMCSRKLKTFHLKQHVMAHKKDKQQQSKTGQFKCPHCFNRYDIKSNLSVHRRFLCPLQDLQEDCIGHTCGICLATFENVDLLSIHKMIHVVHVRVTEDEKRIKLRKESENITDVEFDEVNSEGLDKKSTSNDGIKHEEMGTDIQDNMETELMDDSTQVSEQICSSCNLEFTSAAALKEHQKRVSLTELKYPQRCQMCSGHYRPVIVSACDHLQHKKQFKFFCQFCGWHFENNNGLERHINHFHDYENKKECPGCHQIFGPVEYQQHVEYNRKEVERLNCKCLSCGTVFVSPAALNIHTKRFNNKCDICLKHFKNMESLTKHRKQYHNVYSTKCRSEQDSNHWCKHCDKFFEKASLLSAHVKSVLEEESSESLLCSWEYKYSTCLHCGITYTNHSDYRLHKFIWRHECHCCNCHFQSEKQLKSHYQCTHATRENVGMPQIFRCKYCGHSFDTLRDKIKHESKTKNQHKGGIRKFPLSCVHCNEMLDTVCQLDVHRRRHKQKPAKPAIVSCRFCRLEFTQFFKKRGFYRHAVIIDKKCEACGMKLHSTCHQRIHMKNICHGTCQCMYCGAQFKSMSRKYIHEKGHSPSWGQARCSMCVRDLAWCQITDHREHMKGKRCAYCLETIPSEDHKIPPHQRLQNKLYLCSCGETIQATCQKKLHRGKFVCCKCGTHFVRYQELVTHLVKYNIGNVHTTITASEDNSRLISKRLLTEIATWDTVEEEGKTMYVCLYCGDKVNTYEEMMHHKSTFKYECPQCKKHFRTPLAANHHFMQVYHDTCRSQPEITKKTGGPMSVTKRETLKAKDDILTQYCQQSVCDELYQQDKENEQHSGRMTLQIGFEEYSILPTNPANVKEDIALDDSKAQNGCPVSINELSQMAIESSPNATKSINGLQEYSILTTNTSNIKEGIVLDDNKTQGCPVSCSNEMPVMASDSGLSTIKSMFTSLESSFGTIKSILTSCEAKSVEQQPAEEHDNAIKVPRQAAGEQYTCIHCKKQFISSNSSSRHLQHTKGLLYTCTKCDRSFDLVCGLEYHIACMCKHCGMHFSSIKAKKDHEQQCEDAKRIADCKVSSSLVKDEREDVLIASVKESRTQAVEDEELMQRAVETDDGSDEETDNAPEAEGMEVVSRNEVDENRSSVHSKQDDVDAVKGGTPTEKETDVVNIKLEIKRTIEERIEKVCSEVEAKLSSVHSVDGAKDDTQIKKENDDVSTDFEVTKTELIDAVVDSEAGKEVLSHQSKRVRTIKDKELSRLSLRKPVRKNSVQKRAVTRKGSLQKGAVTDEKKCEFCLQTSSKLPKKLAKSRPCYQNDESLKWMRCVCLHCNLELPTKCHVNFHLDMFERCTNKKHGCGKHFTTLRSSRMHSCQWCGLCVEISFGSKKDLAMHKKIWHKIGCEKIPVPRASPGQCGSIDQIKPLNTSLEIEATNCTTKSDAAESSQPVSRKRKQSKQEPTKRQKTTMAIAEKAHKASKQVILTATSDGVNPTQALNAAMPVSLPTPRVSTYVLPASSTKIQDVPISRPIFGSDASGHSDSEFPSELQNKLTSVQNKLTAVLASQGLERKLNKIALAAETSSIRRMLLIGEEAENHFVECVTLNNQSYLIFNHPASYQGIHPEKQNDKKFSVMIIHKDHFLDQNRKTSCEMGSPRRARLVVKIGESKVHTIERLNNLPGNYTYIVELITSLPVTSKEVTSTLATITPRQGNSTISVTTKEVNPRPLLITKEVNSALPFTSTIREINSTPAVTSEVNSVTPVTTKENPIPLFITKVVNSTSTSTMREVNSTPAVTFSHQATPNNQIAAEAMKDLAHIAAKEDHELSSTLVKRQLPKQTQQAMSQSAAEAMKNLAHIAAKEDHDLSDTLVKPQLPKQIHQTMQQSATKLVRLRLVTAGNPSGNVNVAILPGGLVELANIELGVTEQSSIGRTLLIGEKGGNHFVECVTINNQSYLTFNHPASHMGILYIAQQNEENLFVMIKRKDQNSKPSCELVSLRRALVVDIGQCKVHTIKKLHGYNCAYVVELTKTLPITKQQVNSTPVTSKEVQPTLPITTNQVDSRPLVTTTQVNSTVSVAAKEANSRPLVTTKQVNSLMSVATEGANSSPLVTTKQMNSTVSMAAKGVNSRPVITLEEVNSASPVPTVFVGTNGNIYALDTDSSGSRSITNTYFSVVPHGLIGFTDILFDTIQASITNTLLLGEKANSHFVECVTINDESYLKFNHPGNYTGVITSCEELISGKKRLTVTIAPNSSSSEGASCMEALVVKVGQYKVHTVEALLNIMHVYSVDLSL
ncbi:uncharacterized protein [Amphiura filiformis]|uniref:uncharacterized protein n=1 Tax=Amphiura filiformis TaxID=82378 RepID=UPI003B21CCA0